MSVAKLHPGEVDISAALVRQLLLQQAPAWADQSLTLVDSAGTDHVLYRLGTDAVVRMPRIGWADDQAAREATWLPVIAPYVPVTLPQALFLGAPTSVYPWHWSIYRWLPGVDALSAQHMDDRAAADTLAAIVAGLRRVPTTGGSQRGSRGGTLQARDDDTRAALNRLAPLGLVDTRRATQLWQQWVAEPVSTEAAVWLHSDIHGGNLLVVDGRISALIDFGGLTLGDPAVDLTAAWTTLSAPARAGFAEQLGIEPAQWRRGQAWALSIALIQLPYYHLTNPVLAGIARRTIHEIQLANT
jgi:aminoglycoside phosphotransferase (APT) family kinase protein